MDHHNLNVEQCLSPPVMGDERDFGNATRGFHMLVTVVVVQ